MPAKPKKHRVMGCEYHHSKFVAYSINGMLNTFNNDYLGTFIHPEAETRNSKKNNLLPK